MHPDATSLPEGHAPITGNVLANDQSSSGVMNLVSFEYTASDGHGGTRTLSAPAGSTVNTYDGGHLTVNANGSWTYAPPASADHSLSNALPDGFNYTVHDGNGLTASSHQDILVTDTAPKAIDDHDTVKALHGATTSGNVIEGLDTDHSAGSHMETDDKGQDKAGTHLTEVRFGDHVVSFENPADVHTDANGKYLEIKGDEGTLKIREDGSYTYTLEVSPGEPLGAAEQHSIGGGNAASWSGVDLYAFDQGTSFQNAMGLFDPSLADDSVTFTSRGIGVEGTKDGMQSPDQINHDSVTGESQALAVDFHTEVVSAKVTVSNLFLDEEDGEIGKWQAFDAEGKKVGEGTLDRAHIAYTDNNVGTADISVTSGGHPVPFQYVVFTAMPYADPADNPHSGDSSDYFVRSISYTTQELADGEDVFQYTFKDGDGDSTSANLLITTDDSGIPMPTLEVLPDSTELPEGNPQVGGNVLANDHSSSGSITLTSFEYTDVNGHSATATAGTTVTTELGGHLTVNADGTWTYTPPASADHSTSNSLPDGFSYTVRDGNGLTAMSHQNIIVTDDTPAALNDLDTVKAQTGAKTTGNVIEGLDPDHSTGSHMVADDKGQDASGTHLTEVKFGSHVVSFENPADVHTDANGKYIEIDGDHGRLQIRENGSYTYTVTDTHVGTGGGTPVVIDRTDFARTDMGFKVSALTVDAQGHNVAGQVGGYSGAHGEGFGVDGNKGGINIGVDEETGYVPAYGASEKIVVDFDKNVNSANITLDAFYNTAVDPKIEVGKVTAYLDGEAVGTYTFSSNAANGDLTFPLDFTQDFDQLVFEGLPYQGGQGSITSDSSDFLIRSISFTPSAEIQDQFEYSFKDGDGDKTSANLLIDFDKSGAPAPTLMVLPESTQLPEGNPQIGGNVLTNDVSSSGSITLTSFEYTDTAGHTATATAGSTVTTALGGHLTVNANGTWSYTPPASANHTTSDNLQDGFNYTVRNGNGLTASSTQAIIVTDDTPVAQSDLDTVTDRLGTKTAGNVIEGTDADHSAGSLMVADDKGQDAAGTHLTEVTFGDHVVSFENPADVHTDANGKYIEIDGDHGRLQIRENGSYTYTVTDPQAGSTASQIVIDRTDFARTDMGFKVTAQSFDSTGHQVAGQVGGYSGAHGEGFGVKGNPGGVTLGVNEESGYIPAYGASEKVVVDFDRNVGSANITLDAFYNTAVDPKIEVGKVTAYLDGEAVGTYTFTANNSNGDLSFPLDFDKDFDRIVFEGLPYQGGQGGIVTDSSDFLIKTIAFTPSVDIHDVFQYTFKDGDGDKTTATLTINEGAEDGLTSALSFHGVQGYEDGTSSMAFQTDANHNWHAGDLATGSISIGTGIDLSHLDSDDKVTKVTIEAADVPSGAVVQLNGTTLSASGGYITLTGTNLDSFLAHPEALTLKMPQNSDADTSLTFQVTVTDPTNNATRTFTGEVGVVNDAVADRPYDLAVRAEAREIAGIDDANHDGKADAFTLSTPTNHVDVTQVAAQWASEGVHVSAMRLGSTGQWENTELGTKDVAFDITKDNTSVKSLRGHYEYSGIGISGGIDGGEIDTNSGKKEVLRLDFDNPMDKVTLKLSALFDGETKVSKAHGPYDTGYMEQAKWTAYGAHGEQLTGTVKGTVNGLVDVSIDAKFPITRIELSAIDDGAGNTGDNSDFLLRSVVAQPADPPHVDLVAVDVNVTATFSDYTDGSEQHFVLVELPDGWTGPVGSQIVDGGPIAGLPDANFLRIAVSNDALSTGHGTTSVAVTLTAPESVVSKGVPTFQVYAEAQETKLSGSEVTKDNNRVFVGTDVDPDADYSGKGNEGVGNGQDAPPPGHSVNQNDGAGTGTGDPNSQGGADNTSTHGATQVDGDTLAFQSLYDGSFLDDGHTLDAPQPEDDLFTFAKVSNEDGNNWTDVLEVDLGGGPAGSLDQGHWTLTVDGHQVVDDREHGAIHFDQPASGTITTDGGQQIVFEDVDKIEW